MNSEYKIPYTSNTPVTTTKTKARVQKKMRKNIQSPNMKLRTHLVFKSTVALRKTSLESSKINTSVAVQQGPLALLHVIDEGPFVDLPKLFEDTLAMHLGHVSEKRKKKGGDGETSGRRKCFYGKKNLGMKPVSEKKREITYVTNIPLSLIKFEGGPSMLGLP
jgi:hypothetical protein